ncbi:MAG TPA: helix-turn-helix domain-containing protein [Dehalococcoidia bacterium]|nr:helix-turn-helix domain-containing protein [Dehalococcoidia bacterium]
MSPLGETLRRARLSKGITIEDAERVTRIPRKYLEALEVENYGILPAPVYARGFLRSYAGYLGLDPGELLPFFPVGHVEEPTLENLPEVRQTRSYNPNSLIALGIVAFLIVLVFVLYSFGREDGSSSFIDNSSGLSGNNNSGVITGPGNGAAAGAQAALKDLAGQSVETAVQMVNETGASYVLVGVSGGDVPANTVVDQSPAPGTNVGQGDTVTIYYQR